MMDAQTKQYVDDITDVIVKITETNGKRIVNAMDGIQAVDRFSGALLGTVEKMAASHKVTRERCDLLHAGIVELTGMVFQQRKAIAELHERLEKVEKTQSLLGLG